MSVHWRNRRATLPSALALGFLLGGAASAPAIPQQDGLLNLAAPQGGSIPLLGAGAGDRAGDSGAGVADFDGDGAADVAVGAWKADPFGRTDAGSVFVTFGPFGADGRDLTATQGITRIDGAASGDGAGVSVTSAGDFNGDGRLDLVVGANGADPGGKLNAGAAYIVFGTSGRGAVDLASPGARAVRFDGAAAGDELGASVSGVGDVNGDGLSDVLLGARGSDNNGRPNSGSGYVVFGTRNPQSLDLSATAAGRFARIDGAGVSDQLGARVSDAGDANGDGLADLVLSAPAYDPGGATGGRTDAGAVFVVFGVPGFGDLDVGGPAFSTRGFRIDGAAAGDQAGYALAALPDSDGDGRSELLIGAPRAEADGRIDSGAVFMVRGGSGSDPVDLADLGARSVRIDGALSQDYLGVSVASVGDMTGDGRGDLMIGANGVDAPGVSNVGAAYLITRLPSAGRLDLASPEGSATIIRGAGAGDATGSVVASTGDVTGDGRPDALVGARQADPLGRTDAGTANIVLGYGTPQLAYPPAPVSGRVGASLTPVGPTLVARTGRASFGVSPALPAGLTLDANTGAISGVPQAVTEQQRYTVEMRDLAGSASTSVPIVVARETGTTTKTSPRRVLVSQLRTRCIQVARRQPCRVRVEFRSRKGLRLRIVVQRLRARKAFGVKTLRTRSTRTRVMLPKRFKRRMFGPGRYRITVRGVGVKVVSRPAARSVRVVRTPARFRR